MPGENSGRILVFIRQQEREREERSWGRGRQMTRRGFGGSEGYEGGGNDGGKVSIVLCSVPGGWAPLPLARSLLLLLLFFITIFAFPTFCFMLMVAPCCYPLHQPPPLAAPPHSVPTAVASYAWPRGTFSILSRI